VRIEGQHFAERARLGDRGLRRFVYRVVAPLTADLAAQLEREHLCHDERSRQVEILAHVTPGL